MPTYDYECAKCKYRFEKFQKMTDEPVKRCPKCGGLAVRLIGTGGGIIFKGSGFYETDYKKKRPSMDKSEPACPKKDICKGCPVDKKTKSE